MKKNYFLGALLTLVSSYTFAQKAIILNGGQFGNQNENVNVQIYDPLIQSSFVIDTIHTQSVQEIIFDGNIAFVAAQDSLVSYDLSTGSRVAATRFNGVSTKSLAIFGNELLVGNFYGVSTSNLMIYNKTNLNLLDSVQGINKPVKSIVINSVYAYVTQNETTSSYSDTLGQVFKIHIPNRAVTDSIQVPSYSGDMGQIIEKSNNQGFITLNASGTISEGSFASSFSATNTSVPVGLGVTSKSQYAIDQDTLFVRTGDGIAAINMTNLSMIDTLIVDTVVTGFTYDSNGKMFHLTQTDYFSYNQGQSYTRGGVKTNDFIVGFSPEVIRMYYGAIVNIDEIVFEQEELELYPNPTNSITNINLEKLGIQSAELLIIDLQGRIVLNTWISEFDNSINVGHLKTGSYFVLLREGNSLYKTQIIKQ